MAFAKSKSDDRRKSRSRSAASPEPELFTSSVFNSRCKPPGRASPEALAPGSGLKKGDTVIYRPLADLGDYPATITALRIDGTVDITMKVGTGDPLNLTRIPFVARVDLAPGTACA